MKLFKFQILIVLSKDALAIVNPSGEYETDDTLSSWPLSVFKHLKLFESQILIFLSQEALAIVNPSGEYDTYLTISLCWSNVCIKLFFKVYLL